MSTFGLKMRERVDTPVALTIDAQDGPKWWNRFSRFAFACLLGVAVLAAPSFASEPLTIDDLGFNAVTDDRLFSSGFKIRANSELQPSSGYGLSRVSTFMEVEEISQDYYGDNLGGDNLDTLNFSQSSSQGLKVKRLSAEWENKNGTLTVGSDWANFQDFLYNHSAPQFIRSADDRRVAEMIKWTSPSGFSISLEDVDQNSVDLMSSDMGLITDTSPSVILSWQGGAGGRSGQYELSAMGRTMDVDGDYAGNYVNDRELGWGLNLKGGWQFGDLFAALSVTISDGIDSLILGNLGEDLTVNPTGSVDGIESISIKPSLKYSMTDRSDFHMSLGHYNAKEASQFNGIDTLDTIHVGYSWSPWPSTRFGVEVIGQDVESVTGEMKDSTQVKFGAMKNF